MTAPDPTLDRLETREPRPIGYITDDPTPNYRAGLDAALTLEALRDFLAGWPNLAPDSLAAVRAMTAADFTDWRAGLAKERRRRFAGEEWAARFVVDRADGMSFRRWQEINDPGAWGHVGYIEEIQLWDAVPIADLERQIAEDAL